MINENARGIHSQACREHHNVVMSMFHQINLKSANMNSKLWTLNEPSSHFRSETQESAAGCCDFSAQPAPHIVKDGTHTKEQSRSYEVTRATKHANIHTASEGALTLLASTTHQSLRKPNRPKAIIGIAQRLSLRQHVSFSSQLIQSFHSLISRKCKTRPENRAHQCMLTQHMCSNVARIKCTREWLSPNMPN